MNTTFEYCSFRRRLRRAAFFVAASLCLAVTGWAQRQLPVPPSAEPVDPEETLASKIPAPAQCPSKDIVAGVDDQFVTTNGPELTAPSAALQAALGGPYTEFDGTQRDKYFAHTFRLPPCKCIVGAKLEFRTKSLDGLSSNDYIGLGFSTLAGFPRWARLLNSIPGPNYSLDLAALPGPMSLLSAMQTNRYLDFYVQDDTAIDYLKLTVTMCDCCQAEGRAEICILKFDDKNRNGIKDANEPGIAGWTFVAKDLAGGNVVMSQATNADGGVCIGVAAPATYAVSEVPKPGWTQTTPSNPANPLVNVNPGGSIVNLVFGNWHKGILDSDQPSAINPN